MSALTPYDTGEVLEPKPWLDPTGPTVSSAYFDRYGKVDFDNDESATICTIQILRNDPLPEGGEEFVIRISGDPESFLIEWGD